MLVERQLMVTNTMNEFISKLTPDQQTQIAERLLKFCQYTVQQIENIKKNMPLRSIGKVYIDLVDEKLKELLSEEEDKPVFSCRKGCAHCCHMNVDMSLAEAMLIVWYCSINKIPIDTDRLRLHKGLREEERTQLEESACVFLNEETNMCRIYEVRPVSCRKYFVATPPEKCNPKIHKEKDIQVSFYYPVEEIVIAFHNAGIEYGDMSTMIEKALLEEQKTTTNG